jgi:hypothetical protein
MRDWQGGDDESNSNCRYGVLPVCPSKRHFEGNSGENGSGIVKAR